MLRSRCLVILVQYWHRYSAIMAQPDAKLLHFGMPYKTRRGAEKLKNLIKTVPSCSIRVLKNMAFLADFKWFPLDSRKAALKNTTTQDFFAFTAFSC